MTALNWCRAVTLYCAWVFSQAGYAAGVPTPQVLPGGQVADLSRAQALVATAAPVFDVRSAINYGRGHIPGAVLAPYKGSSQNVEQFDAGLDRFAMDLLPADKDQPVLFYSHGDTGWKSYKAAILAIRAGYRQVHWFRDGYAAWVEAGLDSER